MIQSISRIMPKVKGNVVFILTNKYVRSKNEKKLDIYIDRLYNKEENPLLVKELGFCFAKQGGKSSARQRARIFLRKTRRILC